MKNQIRLLTLTFSLLLFAVASFAQKTFTVTGKVTEEEGGAPMPGVSIVQKGTDKGTLTDDNGQYKMVVPDQATLVFSSVGTISREFLIANSRTLDVALASAASTLGEVVVIGYGTVNKKDLTGSVSSVKSEDIVQTSPINIEQALQGRAAGVQIISSEGSPDAGINIRIRGASSVNASNSPLYVIDGFPVDGDNKSSSVGLGNSTSSPLSGINPSDIESIEVLKDASATAIYGSRGSNGVIIISTKSGKKGIPKVTLDMNFGVSKISKYLDVLDGQDFINYYHELTKPPPQGDLGWQSYRDTAAPYTPIPIDQLKTHDWQREAFRNTYVSDNKVAISGGTDYTKYYAGLGYTSSNGIVRNNDYQRFSLNFKLEQKIKKTLKIGINLTAAQTLKNGSVSSTDGAKLTSGLINNIALFRPVEPNRYYAGADLDPTGELVSERSGELVNPNVRVEKETQGQKGFQTFFNTFLEYEPIKGLRFNTKFGGNLDNNVGRAWYPAEFGWGRIKGGGLAMLNQRQTIGWLNENTVNYEKTIAKDHKITLLAGFTNQKSNAQFFQLQGQGFQIPGVNIDNISSATVFDPALNRSDATQWTLQSGLSRFNYSYKGKYLLTASVRRDGSSRFAPGNKWGTFPSAAFAWNAGEEKFVRNLLPSVSTFKFRVSYGLTGNQGIPLYQSQATLNPIPYEYSSSVVTGLYATRLANPALTWEKTKQFDAGFELGFLNNRFELNVDYYKKNTFDLLLAKPISYVSGFSSAFFNIGSVFNEGLEISLNTTNIKTKDFSWATNFNISFNRNTVGSLGLDGTDRFFTSGLPYDGSYSGYLNDYMVQTGQAMGAIYGWKAAGVYQYADFTEFDGLDLTASIAKFNEVIASGKAFTLKSGVAPYKGNSPRPGYMRLADIAGPNGGAPDGIVDENDRTIIGNPTPKHFGGFSNNFKYKGFTLDVLFTWSYGNDIYNKNLIDGASAAVSFRNQWGFVRDRWTPEKPSETMYAVNGRVNAGADRTSSFFIEDGSYLRLQNVTLSYNVPNKVAKTMKIGSAKFFVSLNNLHVWTKYRGFDPEVSVGTNALTPGIDFAAYPRSKNARVGLSVSF